VRRDGYGKLRLLQLPRDSVVPGPGQVQNNFNADPSVTQLLALLRGGMGGGSSVKNGNLLTLPVGGGLLYVQPVYVQSAGGTSYPLLQKVLVAFGDKIGFQDTLPAALDQVFGGNGTSGGAGGAGGTGATTPTPTGGATPAPSTGSVVGGVALQQALQDAAQALRDSNAALKAADLTAYAAAQKRLSDAVNRAVAAESAASAPVPTMKASVTPSPTS